MTTEKEIITLKDHKIITVDIKDLKEDKSNPNVLTLEQMNGLEKSMINFGRLKHIVVDQDLNVIDGAHRLEIEEALGTKQVNVIQVQVKDEIERKIIRETLNKLHGTYNKEKESSELLAIFENQRLDELAELLAQPKQELENLIQRYNPEVKFEREEDESKLPSLYDTESFVKKGEIWQCGKHKILCGDSHNDLPILLENVKPDLLLTDPPYGIGILSHDLSTIGGAKPVTIDGVVGKKNTESIGRNYVVPAGQYRSIHEDDKPFDPTEFLNIAKNHILFGANYFCHLLPISPCWLIWYKRKEEWSNKDITFAECELAWSDFTRPAMVYNVVWMGLIKEGESGKRIHPTQKPVKLFYQIIKDFTNENNTIVDPFLGSGSTLIACEQTNRICYGLEIDEHYSSVICERFYLYSNIEPIRLSDGKTMSEVKQERNGRKS